MLSEHEQRALEEIERSFGAGPSEPVLGPPGEVRRRDAGERVGRLVAAAGGSVSFLLLIVGVPVAAIAIGTSTWLLWLVWRYRDVLSDRGDDASPTTAVRRRPGRAACRRRGRQLVEHLRRVAEAK